MRRSSHIAWLCLAIPILVAPVAHAQALKVENAQLQDKFIVVKSVEAPSDAWLVAHNEEVANPATSSAS